MSSIFKPYVTNMRPKKHDCAATIILDTGKSIPDRVNSSNLTVTKKLFKYEHNAFSISSQTSICHLKPTVFYMY